MSKWIPVDGYKNLPVGNWLVQLSEPHFHNTLHTASVHPNVSIIGGSFGFDLEGDVIAYRELPKETETEYESGQGPYECAHS